MIISETLKQYIDDVVDSFSSIPEMRKLKLEEVAVYVSDLKKQGKAVDLTFICTHNSRRSHFSQIWSQTAAFYYGLDDITCYSGGTEATAFNIRAVKAIKRCGFQVSTDVIGENPVYVLKYSESAAEMEAFSKVYNDPYNPQFAYAAIMTCSDADENCPVVIGADKRFPITYTDPKQKDDTPEETADYDMRCKQIATEMFYIFSQVK